VLIIAEAIGGMAGYSPAPISKAYSHFLHKKAEYNLLFVPCFYDLTMLTQSRTFTIN